MQREILKTVPMSLICTGNLQIYEENSKVTCLELGFYLECERDPLPMSVGMLHFLRNNQQMMEEVKKKTLEGFHEGKERFLKLIKRSALNEFKASPVEFYTIRRNNEITVRILAYNDATEEMILSYIDNIHNFCTNVSKKEKVGLRAQGRVFRAFRL
jgi:hypothetical protein